MPGYDALEPGYTGNETDEHLHQPYVRHVHTEWQRDGHGQWVSETWDPKHWEVVCTQCGDDEGPAEVQGTDVRVLRGPYGSKHNAEHAAHKHERTVNPPTRWTPGSTVPPQAPPAPW